jgi:hypothetical protein
MHRILGLCIKIIVMETMYFGRVIHYTLSQKHLTSVLYMMVNMHYLLTVMVILNMVK